MVQMFHYKYQVPIIQQSLALLPYIVYRAAEAEAMEADVSYWKRMRSPASDSILVALIYAYMLKSLISNQFVVY